MTFLLGLFLIAILTVAFAAIQTGNATEQLQPVLIPVRVAETEPHFRSQP